MTTPPPAAVRAAKSISQRTREVSKGELIHWAQLIDAEYAPMVEALEKAIGLCHVPECNQDDEWATELSKCEQTLQLLKETK